MLTYDLITLLGPTASGKTRLAAQVADAVNAEIVSADSRQVYRRMDIGTGKDLADYVIAGRAVAHHLIDVAEPGDKYNVFEYQRDFLHAYEDIHRRGKQVLLCGGTGMYIEAVLKGYRLAPVPENAALRTELEHCSLEELTERLRTYKTLHNTTDVDTVKRAVRAIEIEEYYRTHVDTEASVFPSLRSLTVGISVDREARRRRISERLRDRLAEGLVEEVQALLDSGLTPDDLIYYGLEYRYVTLYVTGQLTYDEMFRQLETAIHQFAKRQMTWFRGMERRGCPIRWLDGSRPTEENAEIICEWLNEKE
ncbi:MAG: tRNA (adenosine(37)-N6)-dimethylallyltransferase MiaA [Prevotellaceae bacterium]|jgi:tRNA dimethylallyltransferase|nr:tRNA (adenosine(37)-N6)-dimethylallyltransferase MiaA [Prevotellaceae bacterium]